LKPWDHSYYGAKMLKRDYSYESEKVKEYFPMERVIEQT
jgi:Zn-dependent oligopeptidase